MKNVLKNLNALVLIIGMLSMVTFMTSCEEDKCEGVTCQNDGVCLDGTCDCPDWYSGTNCETETRAQFFGSYSASEVCSLDPSVTVSYSATVKTNADGAGFFIVENLYNIGFAATATLTGDNTFDFANQSQVINGATWSLISGTGSIDGNTISITYIIEIDGDQDNCTLTLSK